MANASIGRHRPSIAERVEAWFAAFFAAVQEFRAQEELRFKLRGADDHLLRDMGLIWTGRRYERIVRDENGNP